MQLLKKRLLILPVVALAVGYCLLMAKSYLTFSMMSERIIQRNMVWVNHDPRKESSEHDATRIRTEVQSTSSSSLSKQVIDYHVAPRVRTEVQSTSTPSLPKQVIDYQDMSPEEIGKFQQAQVEKFCPIYKSWKLNFPETLLDRQMLVSDEANTAYCYVPKTGCTTFKVLLFMTLGAVPKVVLANKSAHPSEGLLERAINNNSFKAKTAEEKTYILQNYYKFIIYRHPAERLVSAYLSKIISQPMLGLNLSIPERNWLKLDMYQAIHPKEFKVWKEDGARVPITITFSDFIQYWILTGGIRGDEHFKTTFELCTPCQVKYSYYGNFNTFDREVSVFNERIGGNLSHLLNAEHQNDLTSSINNMYYSQLSRQQKIRIINLLTVDLLFYYTIFPAEKGSHKSIMGINYELPE